MCFLQNSNMVKLRKTSQPLQNPPLPAEVGNFVNLKSFCWILTPSHIYEHGNLFFFEKYRVKLVFLGHFDPIMIWLEWNGHSILAGMECHSLHSGRNGMIHSIQTGMKCSFHSGRNGMPSTPFQPEWNDPFHSGRNGMVNPLHRHKKYASRCFPKDRVAGPLHGCRKFKGPWLSSPLKKPFLASRPLNIGPI